VTQNKITRLTPSEDKILTYNTYTANDYSILSEYTTKIYDLQLKLNFNGIKCD